MKNSDIQSISELRKGVFGVHVTTHTEPKMNRTNNPYYGRVRKVTDYHNIALGTDYANTINNRLERLGIEGNYVAEKAKGMHRYNDFLLQSDKDENQFYLNIIFDRSEGSHTDEEVYLVDGRLATAEETKEIKWWIEQAKSKSGCDKQEKAGLDKKEQVRIIRPKLQNVVKITLGARVIGE